MAWAWILKVVKAMKDHALKMMEGLRWTINQKNILQYFINEVGNVAWNIDDNVDSSVYWENQIDLCKDMLYMESNPSSL